MAIPSKKDEGMEQAIKQFAGFDRRDSIKENRCIPAPMGCGQVVIGFKDALSAKEFTISGFCQSCQDKVFG